MICVRFPIAAGHVREISVSKTEEPLVLDMSHRTFAPLIETLSMVISEHTLGVRDVVGVLLGIGVMLGVSV